MITEFVCAWSLPVGMILGLYWWIAVLFIGHISPIFFLLLFPCALLDVSIVLTLIMEIFQSIFEKI